MEQRAIKGQRKEKLILTRRVCVSNRYLLSPYCVLGIVVGDRDRVSRHGYGSVLLQFAV